MHIDTQLLIGEPFSEFIHFFFLQRTYYVVILSVEIK